MHLMLLTSLFICYSIANGLLINSSRIKRQNGPSSGSGSQGVGLSCNYNVDCLNGAFCENGVCACVSTYVSINNYCYPKVNPDQPGCNYQEQCNSVWPGATCVSNVCKCPYNRPPQDTRDGPVCFVPGGCPTNDQWPKLRNPDSNTVVQCSLLPPLLQGQRLQLGCGSLNANGEFLYDCVNTEQPNQGYCCPTRAFACIQTLDQGTTSNSGQTSVRYFYNSITQSCQQFSYLGAGGNGNNFASLAQCESYCKQDCKRGTAEFVGTNPTIDVSARKKYCTAENNNGVTCSTNFECQRSGSTELCCPTVAFVCSPNGGIPSNSPPISLFDGGIGLSGKLPIIRWFYDSNRKVCNTFQYQGQIGNFNNFLSRQECDSFCAQAYCTRGEPLKDSSGFNAQSCSGNSQCPATHICETGVCCPSKYTVCNQPKLMGGVCNNYATRFWFNVQSGSCEQFLFTGCQGNANNFGAFLDCQQFCSQVQGEPRCPQGKALKDSTGNFYKCGGLSVTVTQCPSNYDCHFDGHNYGCCASRTTTCQIGFSPGRTCGPTSSSRWFFDNTDKTCKTFVYFGCDGNSNNFATQRDCIDYCRATGCPDGGEPQKNSQNQAILCGPGFVGKSACAATHKCTTISASSLAGNSFTNSNVNAGFINYCCPKKSTICSQTQNPGVNCGVTLQRYFYDRNIRQCSQFTYFGCAGNSNNFPDAPSCQRFCDSSACQAGEVIYTESGSGSVRVCNPGSNTCPAGFNCVQDVLANRFVCCGSPVSGSCPAGQKEYIDGFTGQARKCTVNVVGSCPSNFFCYYNPTQRQYFCCSSITAPTSSTTSAVCGTRSPYASSGVPQQCSSSMPCPQGFSCIPAPALFGQIQLLYCCSNAVTSPGTTNVSGGCPADYSYSGKACSPYNPSISCPGGICQYSPSNLRYHCCLPGNNRPTITECTGGRNSYHEPVSQQLVGCNPGVVSNCPQKYQCERDASNQQYLCCPTQATSSTNPLCPNNGVAYSGFGSPQTCFLSGFASCPRGFTCYNSNSVNRALGHCCPSITGNICPGSTTPLMIGATQPRTCNPFAAMPCPNNYVCVPTTNSVYYCCSSGFNG